MAKSVQMARCAIRRNPRHDAPFAFDFRCVLDLPERLLPQSVRHALRYLRRHAHRHGGLSRE